MNDFFSSKAPSEFTKTERRIMNYILENPADFIHMSIGEAARRVGTSEPTISRFARHCGYSDFKELKTALLEKQEEIHSPARKLASSMERPDTSSLEVFLNEGSEVFTTRIYPTRPRCVKLKTEGQPAILRLHALSAHQIR